MRAVLSAVTVLLMAPIPAVAQIVRDSAPNMFFFSRARHDGPAIGIDTRSGSIRDTLGVLVIGVTTNGPADKAGIEEGDRIATANGIDLRLTAPDAGDREMRGLMARRLARAVEKTKVGDQVELRVYHDGQYHTVRVTTAKASDLAIDDEPEFRQSFDDMRIDMPQIRMQLPLVKAKPVEIYDDGVHRM